VAESDRPSRDELKERWGLRLNHHSPAPLWTQVARELRRRIAEWSLPAGHALPSEQFLSDQYGLSRDTVRQAYQAMQEAGLVSSGQGHGYIVAQAVSMQYVQVLPGSKITAPAADPDMHPDMPAWLIVAIKVEAPGMEPVWYDATRTTLIVS
jgi:DNA-binding transcriptional MocR family regulator